MNHLEELQRIAQIRAQLKSELAQARRDAAKLARKAQDEGETKVAIAQAAGVSRVTLDAMLERMDDDPQTGHAAYGSLEAGA